MLGVETSQLRRHVRAGAALTAPLLDRFVERAQRVDDRGPVGLPSASFALVEPFAGGAVPALAVAAATCGQLVLDPARAALDARHQVFGGRIDQPDLERPAAPYALRPVTLEDARHPIAAAELTLGVATAGHSHQNGAVAGRFAPSPTGDLHLGNLRTALVAWLAARSSGRQFLVRMEDLDRVTSSIDHERRQLADLAALGLDWDGEVVRQSDRFDRYRAEIDRLRAAGCVYECFCTRREIRAEIESAASAPHAHLPDGAYPGTCRDLSADERQERRDAGRSPALRLRTDGESIAVHDVMAGEFTGVVDDVVLARADGVPAYNLAVVVDDIAQGVTQVVRGDDLLSSTPRQVLLYRLLGADAPEYLHVPLVLGADGRRLAKRHGAVTLADLAAEGWSTSDVLGALGRSLGLAAPGETVGVGVLLDRWDPACVPSTPTPLAALTG